MLSSEIVNRFNECMETARQAGEPEPTAMVLATTDGQGAVASRTVLLKSVDSTGFTFYTNTQSRKGEHLQGFPRAAATFLWKASLCQVQLAGPVRPVTAAEADAYFASRDRGSQLGAWASRQSRPLDSRETLERRVAELEQQYQGRDVPRPPHWSGYRIEPDVVEFWYGREFRLHDRFSYTLNGDDWAVQRLYP